MVPQYCLRNTRTKKHTMENSTQKVNLKYVAKAFPHEQPQKRHPSISLIPLIMFRPDVKAKRWTLTLLLSFSVFRSAVVRYGKYLLGSSEGCAAGTHREEDREI